MTKKTTKKAPKKAEKKIPLDGDKTYMVCLVGGVGDYEQVSVMKIHNATGLDDALHKAFQAHGRHPDAVMSHAPELVVHGDAFKEMVKILRGRPGF